jgi:hypothetical protein
MKISTEELDLEYMEQEAEDHLSEREARMLGLESDPASKYSETDLRANWHTR